jgi:alpha-L-fucosidase
VWAKRNWAYVKEDWKPNAKIIEQFVLVRARNGNFLLNVGPMAPGDLPDIAYDRMKEFGEWTRRNGERVFDVTDASEAESSNVPMTARRDARYLHAVPSITATKLEWRGARKPTAATLLRDGSPLEQSYENGVLTVDLPTDKRGGLVDVVKVALA